MSGSSGSRASWPAEATWTMRAGALKTEQRDQPRRETVRREVVDGEPELDAVGALLTRRAGRAEADACVVDQHVQGVVPGDQLVGEPVHLAQLGEVGLHRVDVLTRGRLDLGHQLGEPVRRAAVRDDVRAVLGQPVDQGASSPPVAPVTRTVCCWSGVIPPISRSRGSTSSQIRVMLPTGSAASGPVRDLVDAQRCQRLHAAQEAFHVVERVVSADDGALDLGRVAALVGASAGPAPPACAGSGPARHRTG